MTTVGEGPALPPLLDALLRTPGPSGREDPVAEVVAASLPEGVEISRDGVGSLLMRAPGRTSSQPRLAILGHMDEVGVMVTGIDDEGMLAIGSVGSFMPEVLVAQRVRILTEHGDLPGVIEAEPNWFPGREDAMTKFHIHEMRIDIGARSRADAASMVRVGDVAVIDVAPVALANGRFASRSLDDRFGVYVAAEVIGRLMASGGPPADVVGIGTVQEETAFAGAHTTPESAQPDLAVVVDVDYRRAAPKDEGWAKDGLGDGAVIVRGTVVDEELTRRLITVAEQEAIPHVIRAYPGPTSTDADVVALMRTGIPTAVLSVSLRNMHSPVEVVHLDDIEACVRLLVAFAGSIGEEPPT